MLTVTIIREAVDDFRRYQRDKEVNSQKYSRLVKKPDGSVITEFVPSSKLKVGDLVKELDNIYLIYYYYFAILYY